MFFFRNTAIVKTVNSATATQDVCSHTITALKDETTFATAKHAQTMAAAKTVTPSPIIRRLPP